MSQNWSEEWKRTKDFLIRSMFEDIPMLSPIPEANEPIPDVLSPADSTTRACSPLPELIIEREKNLHDEPDEYYQMLEEKMIKLYKKIFLGKDFESDADSSIDTYKVVEYEREVSENSNVSDANDEQSVCGDEATQSDLDGDSLSSVSNISDASNLNDLDVMHEACAESQCSNGTDREESSTSHTYEINVTKVLVHRELASDDREDFNNNEITEQHVTSPFTERSLIIVPTKKLVKLSEKMGERPILTDSDKLVETQAKTDPDLPERVEEEIEEEQIEVMRLGEADIRLIGSLAGGQVSRESITPTSAVERDMSLIQSVGMSPETDSGSDSSEDPCDVNENSSDSYCSRKRTSLSVFFNTESPIKIKRYETRAIQTSSISSEESILEEVGDNFFCGTQLIYKLCRCRDHECT